MPANTAKGYPYPLGTDRVMDGDDAIHNLAEAVDSKLGVRASGTVSVTIPGAGSPGSVAVTFPVGRFTAVPDVVASFNTPNPSGGWAGATGATAAGVTITAARASGTAAMPVSYIASQP